MRRLWLLLALALVACAQETPRQPTPSAPVAKPAPAPVAKPAAIPKPRPAAPAPAVEPAPLQRSASALPAGARQYGPVLVEKQRALWADAPQPYTLAGLIEQETCPSLAAPKCWNPRAELKTKREYGVGLGQVTIAYNADGSERFNEFTELRKQYASLRDWQFADRYDAGRQLTAVVEMEHTLWRKVPPAAGDEDRWAFTDSSYNGGLGGLLQDRRFCSNSPGCDSSRWFGNVETHSLKSKAALAGYGAGRSPFAINREHVRNVLKVRRDKYRVLWGAT